MASSEAEAAEAVGVEEAEEDRERQQAIPERSASPVSTNEEEVRQKRLHAVGEIITTEQTYVKGLQTLCNVFYNPIRLTPKSLLLRKSTRNDADKATQRVITNEEIAAIFGNCDTLLGFHEELLSKLEARFSGWNSTQKIGDIFLQMAPFLKMYISYLNGYQQALATLSRCEKQNADFRTFLERAHSDVNLKGLNIIGFLILPIQRIPRYRMLLEGLMKYTSETHPDYPDLHAALEKIIIVADQVNEQIRLAENSQKVVEIQTMMGGTFVGNLVEPHRRFLHAGDLYKISRKAVQKRSCFLFNDVLVYTRASATPFKEIKKEVQLDDSVSLQFKGRIELATAWLRDIPDTKLLNNAFQVVAPDKTYTFYAIETKTKKDWMDRLEDAINAHIEKNPALKSQRGQVNIPAVNGLYNFFTIPIDELLAAAENEAEEPVTPTERRKEDVVAAVPAPAPTVPAPEEQPPTSPVVDTLRRKLSNWSLNSLNIKKTGNASSVSPPSSPLTRNNTSPPPGSSPPSAAPAAAAASVAMLRRKNSEGQHSQQNQQELTIANTSGEYSLANVGSTTSRTTLFFSPVSSGDEDDELAGYEAGGSSGSRCATPTSNDEPLNPPPSSPPPSMRPATVLVPQRVAPPIPSVVANVNNAKPAEIVAAAAASPSKPVSVSSVPTVSAKPLAVLETKATSNKKTNSVSLDRPLSVAVFNTPNSPVTATTAASPAAAAPKPIPVQKPSEKSARPTTTMSSSPSLLNLFLRLPPPPAPPDNLPQVIRRSKSITPEQALELQSKLTDPPSPPESAVPPPLVGKVAAAAQKINTSNPTPPAFNPNYSSSSNNKSEADDMASRLRSPSGGARYREKPLPAPPLQKMRSNSSPTLPTDFEPHLHGARSSSQPPQPFVKQSSLSLLRELSRGDQASEQKEEQRRLVRVLWDNDALEDGELTLKKGDIVSIINDFDSEWWHGERADRVQGWFPAALVVPYQRPATEAPKATFGNSLPPSSSSPFSASKVNRIAEAMWDYNGRSPDELSFQRGNLIRIIWADDPSWCQGECLQTGLIGWFPSNIIALTDDDDDD